MAFEQDRSLWARIAVSAAATLALYALFARGAYGYFGAALPAAVAVALPAVVQFRYARRVGLRAVKATPAGEEHADLVERVERVADEGEIAAPEVAVLDSPVPNAFTFAQPGGSATVCVTTGLVQVLDPAELDAVLAHELAHVKRGDAAAATVLGLPSLVGFLVLRWGLLLGYGTRNRRQNEIPLWLAIFLSSGVWLVGYALLRPFVRHREFAADRGAAALTGDPGALADALERLDDRIEAIPEEDLRRDGQLNPFFLVPLRAGFAGALFRTHPSVERRVERLRA